MTPERWAQIRQIFDGALDRSPQDRAAYLRVVCARDDELRKEVESLLASHDGSDDFLNTPAADLGRALATLEDRSGEFPQIPKVGPYQLERRIGRGGMGSVWLARRFDHEYEKKVAVKMVKRGMDTQEILRRFRLERQVLAGLDHPNIARLIDGGSTPDGLPYLVMEYVEGTPIDQFCESHQSTISERLRLFRDVCAAVQYAHQNLVVHRDIKAGNILVGADGVPKLLDFGIAKLIRSEFSTLGAAETRPDLRPMTLDYASPEQVRGDPITTATDVYSLGVLLYKLLTEKFPYGPDVRSRIALQQAILEKEPIRPSLVILTDAGSVIPQATQKMQVGEETRAKARRRLKHKLSGDLDMIVLKALRKEPQRRYLSVEQFSEDVRRYLEGRPVIARNDTFGYRTGKFLRRNAAGVAVVGAALILLLGVTIWSWITARNDQRLLDSIERRELALQPALVRAYRQLGDLSLASDPATAMAQYRLAATTARDFLEDQPQRVEVRRDLARVSEKLGDLSLAAAPGDGIAFYTTALAQYEAVAQAAPSDPQREHDVMQAARKLGLVQFRAHNLLAALASFSRGLQVAEAQQVLDPSPTGRFDVAACNFEVGEVLAQNNAREAAVAKLRKALDTFRGLAGIGAGGPSVDPSPAGFEQALQDTAGAAPAELRKQMDAEFARFQR